MLQTINSFSDFVGDLDVKISHRREHYPTSMPVYHYHDFYEIYYLFSGERYYFIEDKTYHIKKGDLVLIKEYVTHSTMASEDHAYDRMLIDFKKDFIDEMDSILIDESLFGCFNSNIHVVSFPLWEQATVENLLVNMLYEYQKKLPGYMAYLKASITQLLLLANRCKKNHIAYNTDYINATHKLIADATGYINKHFSEDLNLEFMSNKFFISTYYFSRVFKQSIGMTFVEYLNNIRIKEAHKLLTTTTLSIGEISERIGYKSNTHFGRIFKQLTNTSPSAYRKMARKKNF